MNYKTVISAALIILAHTAQSQNWKPLYENEVYNFTSSSSTNPIITNYLWIDSVKPGTTYLNLSIKKCDQCNDPGVGPSVTECYKIKQAQFLQKEIRDLGNGVYQFYG
ncbi:MAG TPA: hypothetical protein PKH79_01855, partial [Prolixibacteraceae bacterium]|nr:hypothetical protein [Prolixibacteraceae bacterium]